MQILAALADPVRFQILAMLAQGDLAAGEIAERFDISAPAISQHLKVLRDTGLVDMRAEAQRRIYALNPEAVELIERQLSEMRASWNAQRNAAQTQSAPEIGDWNSILRRLGA